MRSKIGAALAATLFWALALVAPAHAAFPGANGKIAFVRSSPNFLDNVAWTPPPLTPQAAVFTSALPSSQV